MLVTTQVVHPGSFTKLYAIYIKNQECQCNETETFIYLFITLFSLVPKLEYQQIWGPFSLPQEHKPARLKFSYYQKFAFLLKEHIWYE